MYMARLLYLYALHAKTLCEFNVKPYAIFHDVAFLGHQLSFLSKSKITSSFSDCLRWLLSSLRWLLSSLR